MERTTWNAFVATNAPRSGAFLESWEWGEFQEAAGAPVARIHAGDDGDEAVAQVIFRPLPFGRTIAYVPRGPIMERVSERQDDRVTEGIWKEIRSEAARHGAIALRVDPLSPTRPVGAVTVKETQPRATLLLDLAKTEEELLTAMHEKTRYNIRLAAKKGVTVREGGNELFGSLWPLLETAGARDRFRLHPRGYYETMMKSLPSDPKDRSRCSARILVAEFGGKPIAGMILLTFAGGAIYLHGGSSDQDRNVMAPHLLQWEAIRRAKAWGYATYDFWGIAPEGVERHPLAGVTRFKRGFGGEEWSAPASWELPLSRPWYTIYGLAKRIRGA